MGTSGLFDAISNFKAAKIRKIYKYSCPQAKFVRKYFQMQGEQWFLID
jgi:hypothetical protein